VSLTFPGGTALEALNALTRAHQRANWQVGYDGRRAFIQLSDLDVFPAGGVTGITTAPRPAQAPR
jgi:hypothetical protein